jgi:RNA polymerase sigma factor (sigma-70 family)
MTTDDIDLLREYATGQSGTAFATLVSRYTNLVYSTALRQVRDPQLAEEITQVVFIILARKADSFDAKVILPGWLYRTTGHVSKSALKRELRRQHREQEAYMQSTLHETGPAWERLSPLLDEAMSRLAEADRDALVLRFFEGRNLNEIGTTLGVSEEAAKKRVSRAVEKLQSYFSRRGINSTAAIISAAISANSVHAAPVSLAKSVTAIAMTKGGAITGPTLSLVKGALKLMAWSKMKLAVILGASALAVAAGGTALYETQPNKTHGAIAMENGSVPMRIQWMVGKKYSMRSDLVQDTETTLPGQSQPVRSEVSWTQDFIISPLKQLDNGGWQLELQFVNETMDVSQGGRHLMTFSSTASSSADGQTIHVKVDGRIEYYTDANGKVEKLDGLDDFMNHATVDGNPQQQAIFKQMYGTDELKRYGDFGDMLPNRMTKPGESWPVKQDISSPEGLLRLDLNYTFTNWEKHDARQTAHIIGTGSITSESTSAATGALVDIEKGKLSEEAWFDSDLGMIVGANNDQTMKMKITTQARAMTAQVTQKVRFTLVDVR